MLGVPHIDISVYQLELTHVQQSTRVSSAKSSVQRKVVYKRKQCSKGKSPVRSLKEGSDVENKMRGRGSTTALAREVHPSKTRFASFGP